MSNNRPENQLPAEIFYSQEEAKKYTSMSRIIQIQSQLTERAVELLNIPKGEKNWLILDIGCGSGLSGGILEEEGHNWVGLDISRPMLDVAKEKGSKGDLYQIDIGQGFNFRPGVFDAAISVSAIQWLCVAAKKHYNPIKRMANFFGSLYKSLSEGSRAVLQFYPENIKQIDMITKSAIKAGFCGNLVIDYPNSTKAKKLYLVLDAGGKGEQGIIQVNGLDDDVEEETAAEKQKAEFVVSQKSKKIKKVIRTNQKPKRKSKQWVLKKKERMRNQGKVVKSDSKYSGRKRGLIRLIK